MHRKLLLTLTLLALPLGVSNMGGTCGPANGPEVLGAGFVDMVFINATPWEVDVRVDGERIGTLASGESSAPVTYNCSPGEIFTIGGDLRTDTATFPGPVQLTFEEGQNFVCGNTIQTTYSLDANGDLDVNGFSGP